MENIEPDDCYNVEDDKYASSSTSAENFQKYMLGIFEKNGILNDLRAYLRGHIVEVLRSTQTGKPLPTQKTFTQRLELEQQAMNILIVEYLLNMQFSYSLSVYISEIPLANMVFDFSKKLLCGVDPNDCSQLRFIENDVWTILNCLGIQCDSVFANNVIKMYRSEENPPLLICLLKNVFVNDKVQPDYSKIAIDSPPLSQSAVSDKTQDSEIERWMDCSTHKYHNGTCKHLLCCKICKRNVIKLRNRTRKSYSKQVKEQEKYQVENLVHHVGEVENTILGEMFEQLKNVYESEIDMVKADEDQRVKKSLASHALLIKKQKEEMEEEFRARAAELSRAVHQKKQFLSSLAASLRLQHGQLATAMEGVRHKNDKILQKEGQLKEGLVEAEKLLRKRGEEMRDQISKELAILDSHLEMMKKERELIDEEKRNLQVLKTSMCHSYENENATADLGNEGISKIADAPTFESKCSNKCTFTESVFSKNNLLNNEVLERSDGECRTSVQKVINDLKKQKNVNFSQTSVQVGRSESESSHADSHYAETLTRLREENEQLRSFAAQQKCHIDSLERQVGQMGQVGPLGQVGQATPALRDLLPGGSLRLGQTINSVSFGAGAGESVSVFSAGVAPRTPADVVPFIPPLDRRTDHRRQLINQWRRLRKRLSPTYHMRKPTSTSKLSRTSCRPAHPQHGPSYASTSKETTNSISIDFGNSNLMNKQFTIASQPEIPCSRGQSPSPTRGARQASPKSLLREAKQRLRNKDLGRLAPAAPREKSPTAVLQEAKLRLRKLEIEAQAVERSYRHYRARRPRVDNPDPKANKPNLRGRFSFGNSNVDKPTPDTYQSLKEDYENYLKCCNTTINFVEAYFQNKNTAMNAAKPLPESILQEKTNNYTPKHNNYTPQQNSYTPQQNSYTPQQNSYISQQNSYNSQQNNYNSQQNSYIPQQNNYIDTPLTDFRKLYNNLEKAVTDTDAPYVFKGNDHRTPDSSRNKEEPQVNNDSKEKEDCFEKHDVLSISEIEKLVAKAKQKDSLNIDLNAVTSKKDHSLNENLDQDVGESNLSTEQSQLKILQEDREDDTKNTKPTNGSTLTKREELAILNKNYDKLYNITRNDTEKPISDDDNEEKQDSQSSDDSKKNLLRVELEKNSESSNVLKSDRSGKLILTVESSVGEHLSVSRHDTTDVAPMSIVISPKKVSILDKVERSKTCPNLSRKTPARRSLLKRNDRKAAGEGRASSAAGVPRGTAATPRGTAATPRDKPRDPGDDYTDDFALDVDNYASRPDIQSPLSFAKSIEDDNFWDN